MIIQVRAWHKEYKHMWYNVLQDLGENDCYDDDISTWSIGNMMEQGDSSIFEFMLFTGAYDKHNKPIYVGDIVWVQHMLVETIPPYKAVVEWDKYRFALRNLNPRPWELHGSLFPYSNLDPFGVDLEILGNVYENPELVED